MIAWLGGWLKDVVLIIMLAAFVDLLLPNSSMQRYVKVVISLVILLTILTPIVDALFRVDLEKMTSAAFAETSVMAGGEKNVVPLAKILAQGEHLKQQNEEKALRIVEEELSSRIARQVEEAFPVQVSEAAATIGHAGGDKLAITKLMIKLQLSGNDEQANGQKPESAEADTVRPVEPVNIRVRVKEKEQAAPVVAAMPLASYGREEGELRRSLTDFLTEQWTVDKEQIDLEFASPR